MSKVNDVAAHFQESGWYEQEMRDYTLVELYQCDECSDYYDERSDLDEDNMCADCVETFRRLETGH